MEESLHSPCPGCGHAAHPDGECAVCRETPRVGFTMTWYDPDEMEQIAEECTIVPIQFAHFEFCTRCSKRMDDNHRALVESASGWDDVETTRKNLRIFLAISCNGCGADLKQFAEVIGLDL